MDHLQSVVQWPVFLLMLQGALGALSLFASDPSFARDAVQLTEFAFWFGIPVTAVLLPASLLTARLQFILQFANTLHHAPHLFAATAPSSSSSLTPVLSSASALSSAESKRSSDDNNSSGSSSSSGGTPLVHASSLVTFRLLLVPSIVRSFVRVCVVSLTSFVPPL